MNEQFLAALQAENLPVSLDESLGRHTTFRIGGNADFFCVPATVTQLTRILELCRQYQVRTYLLGNGSNTLFSDAGFGGAVICLTGLNSRFSMQAQPDGSTKVLAPAGMMLSALCNTAQKESLAGLEFAFGIPGTVGGAVYMNAGAYGGEIKDVLTAVTFLDENLHLQTLPVQELQMGYRTSILSGAPGASWKRNLPCTPVMHRRSIPPCRNICAAAKKSSRWNTRPPAVPSSALWASLPAS